MVWEEPGIHRCCKNITVKPYLIHVGHKSDHECNTRMTKLQFPPENIIEKAVLGRVSEFVARGDFEA